ncbi:hypothetical protein CEUSTIGMA_g8386.t1 [Chlamydomonas eustigma]|uniref:Uncharacterized protein n=1 Tax=Chlamydomonas eustigma TaxID=1157962 RepID=A0A250XCZ8_9CHLO|nr:hypothetical protein CEUSTIGMA_g8386.t1 [Chlamydomonas eustigma]|eukprot:GAX80951.1 hypothetical protein CEUSTIGMA_g8386.t1 [Chlamydomonas eustigma]
MLLRCTPRQVQQSLNLINDTVHTKYTKTFAFVHVVVQYTIKNLHLPPSQRLTLRGPLELLNVNQPAMIVAALVFVPNVTRNITFGMPAYLASGCDPEVACLCYDDATHSRFWGIIYGIIYFESFINGPAAPLAALRNKGYAYQLVQEPTGLPSPPLGGMDPMESLCHCLLALEI